MNLSVQPLDHSGHEDAIILEDTPMPRDTNMDVDYEGAAPVQDHRSPIFRRRMRAPLVPWAISAQSMHPDQQLYRPTLVLVRSVTMHEPVSTRVPVLRGPIQMTLDQDIHPAAAPL